MLSSSLPFNLAWVLVALLFSLIGREEQTVLNSRKLWSRACCSTMGPTWFMEVEKINTIVVGV